MSREGWKNTLPLSLMLALMALAIWIVRLTVHLTPSQASALAGMHALVGLAFAFTATFTIVSIVIWRRTIALSDAPIPDELDEEAAAPPEQTAVLPAETAAPLEQTAAPPEEKRVDPAERWLDLVKSHAELRSAAERLNGYGMKWVTALGRDFLESGEDWNKLPAIVSRLQNAAEEEGRQERETQWAARFKITAEGENTTPESIAILKKADLAGFYLSVDDDRTIIASDDSGTSYLRSNSEIMQFGKFRLSLH